MSNNISNQEYIEAKTELAKWQAARQKLKYEAEARLYVPAAEVNRKWEEQAGRAKARLLSIPVRLAPQLSQEDAPANISAILKSAITEALDEIAESYENE